MRANKLSRVSKLSKGYASETYVAMERGGGRVVIKIEKSKSPRKRMAEREAENLHIANNAGVGPRLISADLPNRAIIMEFIEGKTFAEFVFSHPEKGELASVLRKLFAQARALDNAGLDHGQLGGRGTNILVRCGEPAIIDFEKASSARKPHNVNQLCGAFMLNKNSRIAKRIRETLGEEK